MPIESLTFHVGTLSYATAGLAFLFLSLLLLTSWRGRSQGGLLALATFITSIWAWSAVYTIEHDAQINSHLLNTLEILRDVAWYLFLIKLLGLSEERLLAPTPKFKLAAVAIFGFCLFLILTPPISHSVGAASYIDYPTDIFGKVILAIIGLALVEQLFRNMRPEQRWSSKFLCLGLGGMFAYDFFLYSDALLFKTIDSTIWNARGITNAIVAPLIAVSAARNPQWSLDVFVSRRIVFHSAALFGAGVYLLIMAAAGYYIRTFGGTWGAVFQLAFFFGAIILLVIMLFSGTMRARFKVFLNKHFFNYKYDYREEWLRFTQTLSTGEPGRHLKERAIQAIAQLVESSSGALWLSQKGVFSRVAHWNLPQSHGEEPANSELCRFLEERQWTIDLIEYKTHPENYGALKLPLWLLNIPDAWLLVPLILRDQLIGFVVLSESKGKLHINWEVSDLLKTAGRQAASYLAQTQATEALMVAQQFESFNRMSAFVVHDIKNIVAQLSLLLSNAEKHKDSPEFQEDMLDTIEHSVEKMKKLMSQLHSQNTASANETPISLSALLKQLVSSKSSLKPCPKLEVTNDDLFIKASPDRIMRIIGHLVQNAIEATPSDGEVLIRLRSEGNFAVIEITDTGSGMDERFVQEQLFRPFVTTKKSGMGIGAYESREYITELGGQIDVNSTISKGSTFIITLPIFSTYQLKSNKERGEKIE